jgi:two-component system NtrC family response regulator
MDEGDYIFSHHVELGHIHSLKRETSAVAFELDASGRSLNEMEKEILVKALEKTNYNQSKAARLLKISRDTLRYRMKKYNLLANPE